jgi:hypothetical protein
VFQQLFPDNLISQHIFPFFFSGSHVVFLSWALCSRRLRRWVPRDLIRNIVAADWPRKGAFYTRPRALTKLVYRRASGTRPELCDAAGFSKVIKRVRLLVKKNPNLQHVHLDTPLPTDMISNILAFLPRSLTFLGYALTEFAHVARSPIH